MKSKKAIILLFILALLLACNLPSGGNVVQPTEDAVNPTTPPIVSAVPAVTDALTFTSEAPALTSTPVINHVMYPADSVPGKGLVYDVESVSTAKEKRAPYGDSYQINRLERPFLKDMTYVPDLDISTFSLSQDATWYYVSIDLVGTDPNNVMGINYGVELDMDHDGFGDHIIWASPPYYDQWDTVNVRIYSDTNHDTGGLSAERSDAPFSSDGYDSLTFNGGPGDSDPDLAWVRMGKGVGATLQFAFKSAWSGSVFMLGVMADAGLMDVTKLDYVDRFTEEQAGSPVKDKKYYPLGELFAVDNTCQEAFGFKPNGYEPRLCPKEPPPQPTKKPQPGITPVIITPAGCVPTACGSHEVWSDALCRCVEVLY